MMVSQSKSIESNENLCLLEAHTPFQMILQREAAARRDGPARRRPPRSCTIAARGPQPRPWTLKSMPTCFERPFSIDCRAVFVPARPNRPTDPWGQGEAGPGPRKPPPKPKITCPGKPQPGGRQVMPKAFYASPRSPRCLFLAFWIAWPGPVRVLGTRRAPSFPRKQKYPGVADRPGVSLPNQGPQPRHHWPEGARTTLY